MNQARARRPIAGEQSRSLPVQSTPLIGRQREVAAARQELLRPDVRLLTLIGPAGIGKTRLALEVAAGPLGELGARAFFVDLAPISDPALVASTIAQTLGVREAGDRPLFERLKHYLRAKRFLLVLDNFEQVVTAAAQVAELLSSCSRLKILVTSRAALRLSWEHEFPVPPLGMPDLNNLPPLESLPDYPAVALFIDRARAVQPDFVLSSHNAQAVAEICNHLDGLPLAIELAAARTKLLSPQIMPGRLQHWLNLLTRGARDLPARHQTMRGAIAWSYDLLEASEQALFRRLSLFVGGCTLEAAEAVCNADGDFRMDVLEGVDSLVGKSLLRQEVQPGGGVRFLMLETIREYGLEQLAACGEIETTKRRHAAFFLTLVERTEPELRGPDRGLWLDRLETEHDNLRAALAWSKTEEGGTEVALRLAGGLWRFWYVRGYWSEGREWSEAALSRSGGASASARAQALIGAGALAWGQTDYERAAALSEESLALSRELEDKRTIALALGILGRVRLRYGDYERAAALFEKSLALFRELGDKEGIAESQHSLGNVVRYQGDYGRAAALHEESLALFRELGDKEGIASSLHSMGGVAWRQGDYERAAALLEESLAVYRELGDKGGIAYSQIGLGNIAWRHGDYKRAAVMLEEGLAICRELGDKRGIADALCSLGIVAQHQRNHVRAAALYRESLDLRRGLGDMRGIAECLEGLAGLAGAQGQQGPAARLLGAAEALRGAIGAPLPPPDRAGYERSVATARAALGEAAFAGGLAEGRAMTREQAVEYALSVVQPPPRAAVKEELPASRQSTPLTHREQEVAALIARGKTNREIATALVITERTAANHVQHILNKLGFDSRTQIAVWAVAQGLHTASPD